MSELRFITPQDPLYAHELALRWEVLRRPLGHPQGSERFPFEGESLHLVLFEDGQVTGCVLFHPESAERGRLFQMAVRPDLHRTGRGARLVRHLEEALRARGVREVHLHARRVVEGFYAALGYAPEDEPYEEVGIPHIGMRRTL